VAHDSDSVTFIVKTAKPITGSESDGDFMRILVNGVAVNILGKSVIDGDTMTLSVPRKSLGLKHDDFRFEFKFVDSTVSCEDPLDWYDHGVVEPLGYLPFVYHGTDKTEIHA
jgi:hypothetical protein